MVDKNIPFFSVVIPVYNSEEYLSECIQSVFSQTCADFELILVDDESKDKSGRICDEWKSKHPEQITVVHQKNTGVYIAKRNGIRASRGSYVYVMDNDDLIVSKNAFELLKGRIELTGSDLVVFNATDNIETGHLLCDIPFRDGETFETEKLCEIYEEFLKTKNLHHIWMMVFRRDLFDWEYEYGESYRMLRDGPSLVLPIISSAKKVLYLKDVIYYWRVQNQKSASKHYDVVGFYKSIRTLHKRVREYSQKWQYTSNRSHDLVKANYMIDISIAAIKARSLASDSTMNRREYLRMLSNDDMFREEYSLKYLSMFRKIIVFFLHCRMITAVNVLSSIAGRIKKR